MAATQTLPQYLQNDNSPTPIAPRHGVVTLYGYGISARVDRGHLILEDGIGPTRRETRFARVGHGLRRLVVIGSDGMVSLAALRWLADQDAAFVMLDRDGSVLATTGPVRPSDARLRRAQALAHQSGASLQIAQELISNKLQGQEKLAGGILNNAAAAKSIARVREAISATETIDAIRLLESRGAYAYWSAWHNQPINFPKSDLRRVPDHWRTFKNRVSPLTGSPRLAANPLNAMLNYFYALLESEARIAVAALGLDPGVGILHADTAARDSLACDVMEPVRPMVDAYLLEWVNREVLRREWFFEQRDGSCRLMGEFSAQLSKTAPTWSTAIAPFAELVSRTLWLSIQKPTRQRGPATRLTQLHRRQARNVLPILESTQLPRPQSYCKQCGAMIGRGRSHCATCAIKLNTAGLVKAAQLGRVASHSDRAETQRATSQRKHSAEKAIWQASELPTWLSRDFFLREIQPKLKGITLSVMASKLGISLPYAVEIRSRGRVPHPRHWQALAKLLGISTSQQKRRS